MLSTPTLDKMHTPPPPSPLIRSTTTLFFILFLCITVAKTTAISKATANDNNNDNKEEAAADNNEIFESLKKAVQSEPGGYVHPSLGLLQPAPCGAARGIGIITSSPPPSKDEDDADEVVVVLRIPLSYQLTRSQSLETLTPLIPSHVLKNAPLHELDDAALLVLLLVHEVGLGPTSKFVAYINSLPQHDEDNGCGWWEAAKAIQNNDLLPPITLVYPETLVSKKEIQQAVNYVTRVSRGMAADYARYLSQTFWPEEWKQNPSLALSWSLCVVSSRGTAANSLFFESSNQRSTRSRAAATTRLVPLMDLVNHNMDAGGFIELTGTETQDMDNDDTAAGAFVVKSTYKNGTKRELYPGMELYVNYNLPNYEPTDWFLSLGFIPPEVVEKFSGGSDSRGEDL